MSKQARLSARQRRMQQEARRRLRRRLTYGLAAVSILFVIGLFFLIRQLNAPQPADVRLPDRLEPPAAADGKAWGPADAPVLIEEFSDFQ